MGEMPLYQVVALNAWFVPMHLIAFWFQDRLLSPRNARALVCARVLTVILALALDDSFINPSSVVSIVLTAIAMTLACFGGPFRQRLLTASIVTMAAAVAELGGTAVWLVLAPGTATSSYAASWANYPAHMAGMSTAIAIEGCYLLVMRRVWRGTHEELLRDGVAGEGVPLTLAACPAVQACLVLVLATAAMVSPDASSVLLGATTVAAAVCAGSILTAFTAAGSLRRRQRTRREAAALERALADAMADSRDTVASAECLLRIHHDLRNHLHALSALVAEGDAPRAARYARDLAAGWRSGWEGQASGGDAR